MFFRPKPPVFEYWAVCCEYGGQHHWSVAMSEEPEQSNIIVDYHGPFESLKGVEDFCDDQNDRILELIELGLLVVKPVVAISPRGSDVRTLSVNNP